MRHEVTTYNTKKALSDSLKKLVSVKPFSKVTVSEIVADCNVNRKTFYYHFKDIQDLLKWMLEEEAFEVVKQFDLLTDYEAAEYFVIDYIEKNKHILNCVYDSIGRDELKRFLSKDFYSIMMKFITNCEKEFNTTITNEYRDFLCDFYTDAIVGTLITLIKNNEPYDKNKLISYMTKTVHLSLKTILKNS